MNFILTKNLGRFKKIKNYQVKTFSIFQDMMFGTPTILIATVLDLIKKNPSKVKLFNSTLNHPLKNQLFGSTKKSVKSLYDFPIRNM